MMQFLQALGLLVLVGSSTSASPAMLKNRNYETHDYYTLHLHRRSDPQLVARELGVRWEGEFPALKDHHFFSVRRDTHDVDAQLEQARTRRRKRDLMGLATDGVLWHAKSKLKPRLEKRGPLPPVDPRAPEPLRLPNLRPDPPANAQELALVKAKQMEAINTLGIHDPIFQDQWHLINVRQPGHDINVTGVWMAGNTGQNTTLAIIDDGLDFDSPDLKDNYFAEGSYDFNDHHNEPRPTMAEDHHGTRCAGEVAAVKNNICGVGVAYNAKVAGIRILSKAISDEDEALAINYEMQRNQIYSCSWGPPDNGQAMDAPSVLIRRSIQNGIQNGRGGLGSVFVFAAGNGARNEDNCNFDGYTNSMYSITIGAIDRHGDHPYYSEKCSASLVVAYSSGPDDAIHTTDVNVNGQPTCYTKHGGTSAAAPLGAGIMALVLKERPDLHWRDLQYLTMETAIPVNLDDPDWQRTYIGKQYSHTYAYGKMDAYALVEAAKTWKSVKPQAWFKSRWQHVRHDIPEGDQGLASHFEVTQKMLDDNNLERLEHVYVTMNIDHTRRGDLSVDLISPVGVVSHLSATRSLDNHKKGYEDWTFLSVVHWGEPGLGNWTIVAKDTVVNNKTGKFIDWRLTLWGESKDPSHQRLPPYPKEFEDDDHDDEDGLDIVDPEEPQATSTNAAGLPQAPVSTVSVSVPPSSAMPPNPTDHAARPVNSKPGTLDQDEQSPPAKVENQTQSGDNGANGSNDGKYVLPSIFPTFGVSPRTQIWIYGAVGAILIFGVALTVFMCVWRRRRRRAMNGRENYEFEVVREKDADDDDEEIEMLGRGVDGRDGIAGSRGGRRGRRAGELYDAFAGESDDEMLSASEGEGEGEDHAEHSLSRPYRDDVDEHGRNSTA